METLVKNDNHITIQGWMVSDLHLSGNDLLVYAIIYGFSQDGESEFYGSRQYLADWCNSTVRGIQKNLNNLIELGLIEQTEVKLGVSVKYKANRVGTKFTREQSSPLPVNKVHTPSEQSSPNNIIDKIELKDNNTILKNSTAELSGNSLNNSDNKISKRRALITDISDKEESKPTKRLNLYEKCMLEIENFTDDESLRESLKTYLELRLKMIDKPIYGVGQWKGLLKTLKNLDGDKVKIVDRATERGWASFYTLNDLKYKNNNKKPDRSIFGETEEIASVRPEQVEGGNFSGQVF